MELKLEAPDLRWQGSYCSLVAESKRHGGVLVPYVLKLPTENFPELVKLLKYRARGIGIAETFVPNETFWLVRDDCEVVGVSNLRLRLNESLEKNGGHIGIGIRPSLRGKGFATLLLAETLKKARERGIFKVLVTCAQSNIASAKVILKNGGVLQVDSLLDEEGEIINRYWIVT